MNKQEKEARMAKYKEMANKGLWEVDDPDVRAFYDRAQAEGVELVSNTVPHLGLFRAPYSRELDGVDIAMVGIPLDIGVPNPRPGTRNAPAAVRFWGLDRNMVNYYNNLCPYDLCNIIDYGDMEFVDDPYSLNSDLEEIARLYGTFKDKGIVPLTIGGEHTCTYAMLKGLGKDDPLAVVHIDAHGDTSVGFAGSVVSDASLFQNAACGGYIDPEKMVQVGQRGRGIIRCDFSTNSGMRRIFVDEAQEKGMPYVVSEIKRVIGDHPCYLTIDTDCIDCGEMPGTTLPEPFGLFGREVRDIIRGMYGMNIVGADLMELSPDYDPTGKSACLAAGLAFEMLCMLSESKARQNGEKHQTHWK